MNQQNSKRQHIKWRLEAFAYDVVCLLLKPFSFAAISRFGGWLLRMIGPRTSKQHIIKTGLNIAFPDLAENERKTLISEIWDNTGRTFAEFPLMKRVQVFSPKSRVRIHGREHLDRLIASKTGAVIVTGHFANWEIMAATLTQSGLPVRITYRKINNPYVDARVRAQREAYGTKFLVKKSTHAGARQLMKALANGESIAILNDQKFNTGLSFPFFGEPAMTATGAARLALKSGAPLQPLSVTRNGASFDVTFHPPITLDNTGKRDADTEAGVKQIVKFTEAWVKTNPAQWFWVHRRWPKELYKKT
ncbi:MAG: lysophospholipid acyltransferase family protein [Maricaulaceae bacterium]